jgi:hypothetical protein
MPPSSEIVAFLTRIANQAFALAIFWHWFVGMVVLALMLRWRPTNEAARVLLALPLASASALAFRFGNVFNGAALGFASIVLITSAWRAPREPVHAGGGLSTALGAASIAFAWFYPHFLTDQPFFAYLYGSPLGLVPCPTLALIIGFVLLGGGLGSRRLSLFLAGYGLFYALFGILRLGVLLDLGLLASALALAALALTPHAIPHVLRGPRTR